MATANNLFPDNFREFIAKLNKHQVAYMVIGGYAMGAYGHFRGTNDLDIFIHSTEVNAKKMIDACVDYGIPPDSLKEEMFLVQKMIGIGTPPLRIEVLKKLDAVDFEYAYQRVRKHLVDGLLVNIVSLDDLILLKRAAKKGRDKARDSEDLSFLEKLKATPKRKR